MVPVVIPAPAIPMAGIPVPVVPMMMAMVTPVMMLRAMMLAHAAAWRRSRFRRCFGLCRRSGRLFLGRLRLCCRRFAVLILSERRRIPQQSGDRDTDKYSVHGFPLDDLPKTQATSINSRFEDIFMNEHSEFRRAAGICDETVWCSHTEAFVESFDATGLASADCVGRGEP
jgi:hypothetical protein